MNRHQTPAREVAAEALVACHQPQLQQSQLQEGQEQSQLHLQQSQLLQLLLSCGGLYLHCHHEKSQLQSLLLELLPLQSQSPQVRTSLNSAARVILDSCEAIAA